MNEYQYFSMLYDELTEDMDYTPWINIVNEYKGTLLDVGCGSGTLLGTLKQIGYECVGLDLSQSMIDIAKKKFVMNHLDIELYVDNMLTFNLNKKFDIITCFFDTLNHLSSEKEIIKSLNNMNNHLNNNGHIIIDLFTREKMIDIDNEEFIFDEYTYYAKWKMHSTSTQIIHNLEFVVGEQTIKEQYVETYFDIKKILPDTLTIKEEIPVIIDDVCERIVYVITKK
ncbi:MAG: class I SAM-dependent methyltransferase [bacterium]